MMKSSQIVCCIAVLCLAVVGAFEVGKQSSQEKHGLIIDTQMKKVLSTASAPSMFEKMRRLKEGDEVSEGIDVKMDFLYDLSHVISLKLESAEDELHLVPTTGLSDMVLVHESCEKCIAINGAQWQPDWKEPVGGENAAMATKKFTYIFLEH